MGGATLENRIVDLWCDGSGTHSGEPGGWAYVLECETRYRRFRLERAGYEPATTNNRMELTALLMGLRALRVPSLVVAHSDSKYVLRPLSEGWIGRWQAKDWRKIANEDLWRAVVEAIRPHIMSYEWVRGHSGVELNERCDRLANEARVSGADHDSRLAA